MLTFPCSFSLATSCQSLSLPASCCGAWTRRLPPRGLPLRSPFLCRGVPYLAVGCPQQWGPRGFSPGRLQRTICRIYILEIYVYMYFFPSVTEYFLLGQGIWSTVKLSHGPRPADLSPLASGRGTQPAMFCTDSCTPSAVTFCCGSGSARNQAGTLHSLEMGEISSTGCWVQVGTSRLLSEHHQRLGSAWCRAKPGMCSDGDGGGLRDTHQTLENEVQGGVKPGRCFTCSGLLFCRDRGADRRGGTVQDRWVIIYLLLILLLYICLIVYVRATVSNASKHSCALHPPVMLSPAVHVPCSAMHPSGWQLRDKPRYLVINSTLVSLNRLIIRVVIASICKSKPAWHAGSTAREISGLGVGLRWKLVGATGVCSPKWGWEAFSRFPPSHVVETDCMLVCFSQLCSR